MRIPDAIGKAPVLFLTGAGASVALGRYTSAQFVNSFFNSASLLRFSAAASLIAQPSGESDVRSERISALQQAISAGTYNVSSSDVADKLIQTLVR